MPFTGVEAGGMAPPEGSRQEVTEGSPDEQQTRSQRILTAPETP